MNGKHKQTFLILLRYHAPPKIVAPIYFICIQEMPNPISIHNEILFALARVNQVGMSPKPPTHHICRMSSYNTYRAFTETNATKQAMHVKHLFQQVTVLTMIMFEC